MRGKYDLHDSPHVCRALVLLVVATGGGCAVDREPKSDRTENELRELRSIVVALHEDGRDLQSLRRLPEMLAVAARLGYLPQTQYTDKDFENDGWGRPYRWRLSNSGDETCTRILSDGRNGKPEDGEGDDLYLQIQEIDGKITNIELKGAGSGSGLEEARRN